jgi:hypothetical protein
MVIVSGLLTSFGRMIGAVATMTVAWATILLFGRIPQRRRTLLSFMTLGSIAWVAALAGVLIPSIGGFFLAAVPRLPFVEEWWLRLGMLALAALLPLAIGVASVQFIAPEDTPTGRGRVRQTLRGYPFTAVYAFMIIFLAIWGLTRKVRSLRSGWTSSHVPVIIKPGRYEEVVGQLETALREAGVVLERSRASRWFEIPLRLLASAGGASVAERIPDELFTLTTDGLEILIYPSDIALLGRDDLVAPARAAVARRMSSANAYLTVAMETQQIEDRLASIAREPSVSDADFEPIDELLNTLDAPYDEWETLLRIRLEVERKRRWPDATSLARV